MVTSLVIKGLITVVKKPTVSIVITVRNAEAFISETLTSILQEHCVPLEVVLVDNGCTDSTIERVHAFQDKRVRIIKGPGKGIAHALNVAYAAVQGELIMRCDGDDLFLPQRIARQVKWLNEHPEFGAVCGGFSTIDSKGNLLADLNSEENAQEITGALCNGITLTHIGTFAIRTEAVRAAGGSREYFDCLEDIDFQLRLGEVCRVWFEPETEYLYRLHQSSVTHATSNTRREFYDAAALMFQKQRKAQGIDDLQRGCPPPVPEDDGEPGINAAEHVQGMLLARAWAEHRAGHKQQALIQGIRSVIALPTKKIAWHSLLALVLKPAGKHTRRLLAFNTQLK
jgi:glycosyltransferase involved in cell wall biosynthesis